MKRLIPWFGLFAIAVFLPGITGCETESANARITITPSETTISRGQSVQFAASGGFDYIWSLEDESRGTLSTRSGERTVYTSLYSPGSNAWTQVLTVTSQIQGDSEGRTNSTGEAYIKHL